MASYVETGAGGYGFWKKSRKLIKQEQIKEIWRDNTLIFGEKYFKRRFEV